MKSLFLKLTLIFLLSAIIPVVISHGISVIKIGEVNKTSVMQGNLEVAKAASRDVANYFQNGLAIIKNVAAELEQLPLKLDEQGHLLKMTYANHPYFQYLLVTDLTGTILATSQFENQSKVNLAPYLSRIMEGESVFSDLYIAKNPPPVRPALSLYLPIKKQGVVDRVLVAELNLVYAWHLVNQMKIGETGEIFLVDAKGNIFASSNMAILFELKPYPEFSDFMVDGKIKMRNLIQKNKGQPEFLVSLVPLNLPFGGILVVRQPASEAFQLARRLSFQMWSLAAVVITLMLFFGYWGVKKMILRPVDTLTTGLEKIAAGHWEHRIQINTHDEFAAIGKSYNDMAGKLVTQADQIKRQERLSLIGKIAGGLIHDLKHPIANIRNWTRLMPTKMTDPKFIDDFTSVVNHEFKNVDLFFMNLKDLTSEMSYAPQIFKLKTLFTELQKRFELDLTPKNISMRFFYNEEFDLKADYFLLTRVLSNLITNAIQFLAPSGKIEIHVTKIQNPTSKTIFTVSDNGPGISPDRLTTLFEDFVTTKRQGLGLGLAISKKIVELHGGDISVESVLQQGTHFTFWLPGEKT